MQKQFYLSRNGKELGPWNLGQIYELVKSGQLEAGDYIFDDGKQDWVPIHDYAPLAEFLGNSTNRAIVETPSTPVESKVTSAKRSNSNSHETNTSNDSHNNENHKENDNHGEHHANSESRTTTNPDDEWYVLKWDNRYGPFAMVDVVKMLQDKSVFEFDYVWKPGFESWTRIAELPQFAADQIRGLKSSKMPELSEVFFRRRHARTKYNGSIVIHDNHGVWKGESFEVSEGGAGVIINNALLLPGQKLFLHFKPGDGVPSFNATCEVVSKKYIKGVKNKEAPICYGVKFIEINGEIQKALREYTSRVA